MKAPANSVSTIFSNHAVAMSVRICVGVQLSEDSPHKQEEDMPPAGRGGQQEEVRWGSRVRCAWNGRLRHCAHSNIVVARSW